MKPAVLLLSFSLCALAQDDLPKKGDQGPMEFEPQLQLYEIKPEAGSGPAEEWAIPKDVEKARVDAERAQKKAERWQQLQKTGVLSKVEAEKVALQANRAVYRYQQARAVEARKQVENLRARYARGEASRDLLYTAETSLKTTEALAAEADALLRRTDVQFASNQLERQRRLASSGLAGKGQVQRAAANLEKVKAEQAANPMTPAPIPPPLMTPPVPGVPGVFTR